MNITEKEGMRSEEEENVMKRDEKNKKQIW